MTRVRLQRSGGLAYFPGLAAPRTIDVDALPESTRDTVINLLEETHFFGLASSPPPGGGADHYTYRITVEDDARSHTVVVSEPVVSGPLQRLIALLQNL
jgi:hypothetical protein